MNERLFSQVFALDRNHRFGDLLDHPLLLVAGENAFDHFYGLQVAS